MILCDLKDCSDMDYKYSEITEKILRAAMNVHNALGNGFQEVIYQRALEIEFKLLNIEYAREVSMPVFYKEVQVGERRVDFLAEKKISVEIKAQTLLTNTNLAQGKNYLEAYNLEIGLLINFGGNSLEWKRLFNNKFKAVISSDKSV
jgi:GxxExxY protein